ncbi:SgcJ/EcaC family oxidoreductase [Pseudogracilibacillus auburnensis]|uniref:Uncharacterized protein (TIGR02246 family) n=1 Tax=Pseudogracilibacillus auburnensis TaxID=1494959 RepID=A0A2V3W4U8_9BACI|nr:SgcJ/EcaC family oxidoreductase [Pseudogracilibacillus auburnensis]PXW83779.1 uncharacterized protein (TIGR02246 family) [Pseudogracilibacillus auburnensis]
MVKEEVKREVELLYIRLINAWNKREANRMATLFRKEGELIGFDGSQIIGKEEIFSHLAPIFNDHPTPPFIVKVKSVHVLSPVIAMLRAIGGMLPSGQTEINPDLNTHHTLVALKEEDQWQIQLFQNTPAQFHGRPELVEQMTAELSEQLKKNKKSL